VTPSPPADDAQWAVPLADIQLEPGLAALIQEVVESGWWSMGPRVLEFEAVFAEFCDVAHVFAVASGTAALQLAIAAIDCSAGDEVILPSLNFVAAANAVRLAGATPIFCDITSEYDLNMDPKSVEAKLTPRTKAIIALHYGGLPCDLSALQGLAAGRGIRLIEDAAHAPGAMYHGRNAGSIGDVGCFSLFSNKNLPVGEGGVVVTNDPDLAERIRLLRSHGMTTLTWDRHRGHAQSYDVMVPGFNFRLDEIRAAMASVQVPTLRQRNQERAAHVARYREAFERSDRLIMPMAGAPSLTSAHHLAVLVLPSGDLRERVRAELAGRRIQTSVHYPPIHQFTAYAGADSDHLVRTNDLAPRIVTLPLFPHMSASQADAVVDGVFAALDSVA
jgi:dTDP-4-amino-4,6-dideoxygalactose transaminase